VPSRVSVVIGTNPSIHVLVVSTLVAFSKSVVEVHDASEIVVEV